MRIVPNIARKKLRTCFVANNLFSSLISFTLFSSKMFKDSESLISSYTVLTISWLEKDRMISFFLESGKKSTLRMVASPLTYTLPLRRHLSHEMQSMMREML